MSKLVSSIPLPQFSLWEKVKKKRRVVSFQLEITARCNNNCRHCFINLPAKDRQAKQEELSFDEIKKISDEAVSLGALDCLLTGGEPLLREDFFDIYTYLKKKGLLVSIFTNATLITERHIKFFKKYPPRSIEVTVYGAEKNTYEKVTRNPGSFDAFIRGVNLLFASGIEVCVKAMALRSNLHGLSKIASFCRKRAENYFRFDPFLHLRFDRDLIRNEEIKSERLSPRQIVELEESNPERFQLLTQNHDKFIIPRPSKSNYDHLFHCGAGKNSFVVSPAGIFRPCSSLWHPDCIYDLRKGSLSDAWGNLIPRMRNMQSDRGEFLERCSRCSLRNLCMWCPAHAYLETQQLDGFIDYFCELAHARAEILGYKDNTAKI